MLMLLVCSVLAYWVIMPSLWDWFGFDQRKLNVAEGYNRLSLTRKYGKTKELIDKPYGTLSDYHSPWY